MNAYSCRCETEKPGMLLMHRPGNEIKISFFNPEFWGYESARCRPEEMLESCRSEHDYAVQRLREECDVVLVGDLLEARKPELEKYVEEMAREVYDKAGDDAIRRAVCEIGKGRYNATDILVQGLEIIPWFYGKEYRKKEKIYSLLARFRDAFVPMNQLYFTQDSVITAPNGLVKPKMAMKRRNREADLMEILLGSGAYCYSFKSACEGGDFTMNDGIALVGIGMVGGDTCMSEIFGDEFMEATGVRDVVAFYEPDIMGAAPYPSGNLMHLDTIMQPAAHGVLLANIAMLKKCTAVEYKTGKQTNAYEWAEKNFEIIPAEEYLGMNGIPLGGRFASSADAKQTNYNLQRAGIEVLELPAANLKKGGGNWHCMSAYLMPAAEAELA